MASQNEIGYVYKITSPSGRIYIGSTNNHEIRKSQYKRAKIDKKQIKLHNSLLKYGFESHTFEVIDKCELSKVLILEAKYGHELDVLGKNGLNCKLPKLDEEKKCIGEETRLKMSTSMRGNKNGVGNKKTPESEAKRIETRKRNFKGISPETREKMRISHLGQRTSLGKSPSEATRQKLREHNLGKKATDEARENMRIAQFKIVFDQQTGIYYESVQEAYSCYRHSYRHTIQMLCGRKRNQTNLIYA